MCIILLKSTFFYSLSAETFAYSDLTFKVSGSADLALKLSGSAPFHLRHQGLQEDENQRGIGGTSHQRFNTKKKIRAILKYLVWYYQLF